MPAKKSIQEMLPEEPQLLELKESFKSQKWYFFIEKGRETHGPDWIRKEVVLHTRKELSEKEEDNAWKKINQLQGKWYKDSLPKGAPFSYYVVLIDQHTGQIIQ